jgi:hypothetical protein
MSDITYKQSYTVKFPLQKCLQVQVDQWWVAVPILSKQQATLSTPMWSTLQLSMKSWTLYKHTEREMEHPERACTSGPLGFNLSLDLACILEWCPP